MIYYSATMDEIIKEKIKCRFDIGLIPNNMGINLCAVNNITWSEQEDGQLVNLTINFLPENKEDGEK